MILRDDAYLSPGASPLPLPTVIDYMPGATTYNIVEAFESFVIYSLALRLQCFVEKGISSIAASVFLPPAIGYVGRPSVHLGGTARDSVELDIIMSLCTDPDLDLPKLCTQTATLLLLSSVSSMLHKPEVDKTISVVQHFKWGDLCLICRSLSMPFSV